MREKAPRAYVLFALLAVMVAVAVALVGHFVALDHGGVATAAAWRLGCGVSLVASLVSGLLVAVSGRLKMSGMTVALGSMLLRLAILALLGSGAALLLSIEVSPFLLAVAASYLALLVVDTGYALSTQGGTGRTSASRL